MDGFGVPTLDAELPDSIELRIQRYPRASGD